MKVLAITNLFPNAREPNRGVFNLQRLEALGRYCEVRVVAPIPWQPWFHGLSRPVPYEGRWNDIPVTYPLHFYTPGVGRAAYAAWMYLALRSTVADIAQEYRPDVLLAFWAYPDAVATAMLAQRLSLPWAAEVLGSDVNVLGEMPLLRPQIRWALRQASCTFAVSHPLKQKLVEIGVPAEAVRVQHNGVNIQRFRLQDKAAARQATGLPVDRRIVVYVGNLKVSKGAADLLEAVRLIVAERAEVPLVVVVGAGPARALLVEGIRRHALSEHLLLAGPRPHAEIPDWIAAADVLTLPSHNEGCPNVVLEALACGRPVVACRVGAVPEFIDESSGAVISPRQPAQLAAALRSVAFRDWEPTALRERVTPLSWEENGRILAAELERAVSGRRSTALQPA